MYSDGLFTFNSLIVLGAGRPKHGDQHAALRIAENHSRVLDWLLASVRFSSPKIYFVCGYQCDVIKESYPEFNYYFNPEWESTNSSWSMLLALNENIDDCLVSYSDIVFHESLVRDINASAGDVVVAIDSRWKVRFNGRSKSDLEDCEKVFVSSKEITVLGENLSPSAANAEFIGLARFTSKAIKELLSIKNHSKDIESFLRTSKLSDLIELLRRRGLKINAVDVKGDWAELNERSDLARFVLGTKAQTLRRLRDMITHARIEDQVSFTVEAWQADPSQWIEAIQQLGCPQVVVRSSALSEDGFHHSNAGAYTSLLNVDANHAVIVRQAVDEVIASYPDGNPANEVLVQPMLSNVLASGVVFTRTLANGAPYYVANYDDVSGSTESITNGSSKEHKTLVMRRDTVVDSAAIPPRLSALLPALREIESLLGYDSLDVEFAVTEQGGLHILQVRPIAVDHSSWGDADSRFYALLSQAQARFEALQQPNPFVQGLRTIFGVMPDWNPAEIIGTKPGQLAISLYRDLIMDSTWATQRAEYGYRDVHPQPLLQVFAGHPYVDVRASLNSFIPAQLPDDLAGRIVEFCLNWLQAHPHLHDKLEFEVIPTCFSLDFDRWQQRFTTQAGLTVDEMQQWRDELLGITVNALGRNAGDMAAIERLEQRFTELKNSQLPALSKAFALLEDARRYGTLPFAHLARSAFVAVTLLRSAVATEVLSQAEVDDFLNSIRTVSHAYTQDAQACAREVLPWLTFVERYGHLRPGTYDITSPSYRQDPEHYLRPTVSRALETSDGNSGHNTAGALWQAVRQRFVQAVNAAGIPGNADTIESFLRLAIEGREYAKFAFTRNLSAALDALCEWGDSCGVSAEVLAQLGIDDLCALQSGQITISDVPAWLNQLASAATAHRDVIEALELPPLLCQQEDFVVFQYPATQANFIGNRSVMAECVDLDNKSEDIDLTGRIVMIPQADPGYDWLFGRRIGGLITMYGGANSHMAIRAAEFGLPAAIGVGEVRYRSLTSAKELELNPINRVIRVLQ